MPWKWPWRSKTYHFNVVVALAMLPVRGSQWVAAHPRTSILSFVAANLILRTVSRGRIRLTWGKDEDQDSG